MTEITVVLEALTTMPVKAFLMHEQGISSTLWKRIRHSGTLRVNGEEPTFRTLLKTGDKVSYDVERESPIELEALPIEVVYEDDYYLVVNKAARMLVHPTTKEPKGTLAAGVLYYFREKGERHAFHPMHRLDRNTSGLVLIAKVPQAQYLLTQKSGEKLFHREYLAVAQGRLTPKSGTIDLPIARALPSIILRKISPEGKRAVTHYETLGTWDEEGRAFSLLNLRLETGRTHQIRVHLAALSAPLLGDDLYGGQMDKIKRQALHACRLKFIHPFTKEEINLFAPPPEDFLSLLTPELRAASSCGQTAP